MCYKTYTSLMCVLLWVWCELVHSVLHHLSYYEYFILTYRGLGAPHFLFLIFFYSIYIFGFLFLFLIFYGKCFLYFARFWLALVCPSLVSLGRVLFLLSYFLFFCWSSPRGFSRRVSFSRMCVSLIHTPCSCPPTPQRRKNYPSGGFRRR